MAYASIDWKRALESVGYVASDEIATMLNLASSLGRPLLLEGPAGTGKTALAKAVAQVLHRELFRLQCFEGMDATNALYDWNYHKQFTALSQSGDRDVFSSDFLLERPLLKALQSSKGAVLLVDEVDRADEAFEALLLEYLGEWQITIPEWKTITATIQPFTLLTSNRTRSLSDALRRRCLYLYLGYPSEAQELAVIEQHLPVMTHDDASQMIQAVHLLRSWPLSKPPGLAETIDWCTAWSVANGTWSTDWIQATLGCVIKDELDLLFVKDRLEDLLTGFT